MTDESATRTTLDGVAKPGLLQPAPRSPARRASAQAVTDRLAELTSVAILAVAVALWARSLEPVDVSRMTDLGLASVLPTDVFVAAGVVTVNFFIVLRQRPQATLVLLLHVVALIVILYGTPSVAEDVPRLSATWRHTGIVDYIMLHGSVDPTIDAYFNWPGFFALSAFVTQVAGVGSPLGFARWAPVVFNLAFVLPLVLIQRSTGADRRLLWLAVWIFLAANWVNQDYFSPQATTYFLYLVVVALLLAFFRTRIWTDSPGRVYRRVYRRVIGRSWAALGRMAVAEAPAERGTTIQHMLLLMIVLVVFGATVPSHQLTPFAALVGVSALVAFRAIGTRTLPLMMLLLIVTWIAYMTTAYLSGHLGVLTGSVGQVDTNVSSGVVWRVRGSAGHEVVVFTRVGLAVFIWLLAFLGLVRRYRSGFRDIAFAALAVAPLLLVGLLSYGGEIVLRIYYFGLPFMAFFVAALFFNARGRPSWLATSAATAVGLLLVGGFFIARYGNERAESFTPDEVNAVRFVDRTSRNSAFVTLSRSFPRKFEEYEAHRYVFVAEEPAWARAMRPEPRPAALVSAIERAMRSTGPDPHLLITRSQIAELELFSQVPPDVLQRLERDLRTSRRFRTVYQNRDAVVFVPASSVPTP